MQFKITTDAHLTQPLSPLSHGPINQTDRQTVTEEGETERLTEKEYMWAISSESESEERVSSAH